jgi:CHAT domain-containing protein/Tfp pilus assembly protein PilF
MSDRLNNSNPYLLLMDASTMRLHLISLSFVTLLLSVTSTFLPPSLSFSPLVAQAQTNQERKAIADRLLREGEYLNVGDNFARAISKFQEALLIYQEIGDKAGVGETFHQIGYVYYNRKEYQQALDYYQQALPIQRELGDGDGQQITLNLMGRVYDEQGRQLAKRSQYREALEKFQQLLVINRKLGHKEAEGLTLNQIGIAYTNLGEYELALDSYQQALAIPPPYWTSFRGAMLSNTGRLYEELGQYELALKFYQEALKLARKPVMLVFDSRGQIGDIGGEARSLNAIGTVHYRQKQYELALDFYQQSLAVLKTIDDKTDKKLLEASTIYGIGLVYLKQEKYELALKFLQDALTIFKPLGYKQLEGIMFSNIGKVYFEQGKYELAWNLYQQSLVIAQQFGNKKNQGYVLKNIGYLLEKQNQPELAIVFFKQSVNAREAIRNNIKGLPQEFQQSYTETIAEDYRHLADLLLQQNRVLEAQRVLDLLKVQELEDYLRNVRGSNNTVQGVAERPQERQFREGTEEIINKAIARGKELTQIENIPVSSRTEAQKQRIVELRKAEQETTKQFNAFLDSPQVRDLKTQLQPTTQGQIFDLEAYATTLQDNLKKLQQDAVILYPFVLPDRLELILVTPYAPPLRRSVPVKREELNRVIVEFRSALQTPTSDATIPGQKLYDWLIKPLENDLAQAKTKTIIYAPDGQLRYIPLAALYDGNQWLVQRFRINNITAVSLTDLNTKPQSKLNVLAAAFTQGNYSVQVRGQQFDFSGLPFAGKEVESLAQTVPGTTKLLDQQFNKDIILQMNDYSVVHLATHAAFVVGQPEESFIMFGNGDRATLRDVKKWRLPNVDLVVLSACETGLGDKLGDGREILGFGYQMQQTSARAAIASLWQVSDGGTQALMNAFYAALQTDKMTKTEALRQAQIALITGDYTALGEQRGLGVEERINNNLPSRVSTRLSHPFYWAPFILIGNGL